LTARITSSGLPPVRSRISAMEAGPSARNCTMLVLSGMRSVVASEMADGPLTVRAIASAAGGGDAYRLLLGFSDGLDAARLSGGARAAALAGGSTSLRRLPTTRSARAFFCRSSASAACRAFSAARVVAAMSIGGFSRAAAVPSALRRPSLREYISVGALARASSSIGGRSDRLRCCVSLAAPLAPRSLVSFHSSAVGHHTSLVATIAGGDHRPRLRPASRILTTPLSTVNVTSWPFALASARRAHVSSGNRTRNAGGGVLLLGTMGVNAIGSGMTAGGKQRAGT
jgi:hypothetical protein